MLSVFGLLGSLVSGLTGIAPAVSSYFAARANVEATEFGAMTAADQATTVAFLEAQSHLNAAKVTNNAARVSQWMILMFGLPPAIHWGAVFLTATFPLGIAIDPLHGAYAIAEKDIAESFFLLAPALPLVSSLSSRLRG